MNNLKQILIHEVKDHHNINSITFGGNILHCLSFMDCFIKLSNYYYCKYPSKFDQFVKEINVKKKVYYDSYDKSIEMEQIFDGPVFVSCELETNTLKGCIVNLLFYFDVNLKEVYLEEGRR